VGGQRHAPATTFQKDPVPIVQEAGWDPGPVWNAITFMNLAIKLPDWNTNVLSYAGDGYPLHVGYCWHHETNADVVETPHRNIHITNF